MVLEEIRPLVTDRLVLRLVDGSDEDAIHQYRSDPAATQYLSHAPFDAEANRERLLQLLALGKASTGQWFNYGWAITLRDSGQVIGDARTWNSTALTEAGVLAPGEHAAGHAALAYVLNPSHQHRGYGREAAAALVSWLFTRCGVSTIVAAVYEPNRASVRLLQSLGFQRDTAVPSHQDTAGKAFPLLMFRLDSPHPSSG
ncbi:GNAT family N-acetyltransferase [Pseudarthrobacter sp. NPDC058329]|uniref:GNAT family N-acetyltransferase n=1 Tax=Pseudarthrobacter sp. NPDC058329 TaxID=3346448 RepID=UPI0036D89257